MDDLYLDNIDEFVNDQNKIVTYKWLSLTLGVHVNLAKQMLYHYLDQKRKESSAPLHATYLVSGKFVENGTMVFSMLSFQSHRVSVVREDQLEDVKAKMSLTVSVHVYSVQKAVLKDSGPLYSADYDAVKENLRNCSRYSAIRCADAVPISLAEVQQACETTPAPPPEREQSKANLSNLASKPTSKQPKGIMGMFANKNVSKNQDSSKEIKLEQKEVAPVVETSKTKPAAKTTPMSNFFGKQAAKKPDKSIKEEVEIAQTSSSVDEKPSSPPPKAETPAKDAVVEKYIRSKTKRLEHSDGEEEKNASQKKKKRRRIKKPQPDSSDDDVIPDSPPQLQEQRDPSPSPEIQVKKEPVAVSRSDQLSDCKRRKRRRVLKSRTFVDDEGCIVTEKAYESESYSETEDDFKVSKPTPKNPTPPKPSTGKKEEEKSKKAAAACNKSTKQASIMGFFQKK
ncbi:DNA polymerase delta subunit 3-like isoform X2 [Coregonus clupeaformis]|uniref:DNA polymerase delta subunit 3-like isoform X2 n=1 Tax=Coregonus clupeaformis TaxID=59861 RepID=UPI001BE098B4|nr:DNA polymerase delta subunit 3-like isoform X2 [Coregonus clupeaformis]